MHFLNFLCAIYPTEVTFQQWTNPQATAARRIVFIATSTILHGLRVEVSENPRGSVINCTTFVKGTVADIQVFRRSVDFIMRCVSIQNETFLPKTTTL